MHMHVPGKPVIGRGIYKFTYWIVAVIAGYMPVIPVKLAVQLHFTNLSCTVLSLFSSPFLRDVC